MTKEFLIQWLVQTLLSKLSAEDLKKFADTGLDMLEAMVKKSPNKIDDAVVLPMCKLIRVAFTIEDED